MWEIRRGDGDKPVNFCGKGGKIRPLRSDEVVVSHVDEEEGDGESTVFLCRHVLGRKAWRIGKNTLNRETALDVACKRLNGKVAEHITLDFLESTIGWD